MFGSSNGNLGDKCPRCRGTRTLEVRVYGWDDKLVRYGPEQEMWLMLQNCAGLAVETM